MYKSTYMPHVFESDLAHLPSVAKVQQLAVGSLACHSDRTKPGATRYTLATTQTEADTLCSMLTQSAQRLSVLGLSRACCLMYTFLSGPVTLYGVGQKQHGKVTDSTVLH